MLKKFFAALILALCCSYAFGHGYLVEPINRASRWRTNETAPRNYNDNQLFCGGYNTQWFIHDGKCGMCGDDFGELTPRTHELGGPFGEGIIVEKYSAGDIMNALVRIDSNHKGFVEFRMCNLDVYKVENEDCFEEILLKQTNGESKYYLGDKVGIFPVKLQLPEKVTCDHCVLQWTYTTGNSWGVCSTGEGRLGCGAQETFRTCSDIAIHA